MYDLVHLWFKSGGLVHPNACIQTSKHSHLDKQSIHLKTSILTSKHSNKHLDKQAIHGNTMVLCNGCWKEVDLVQWVHKVVVTKEGDKEKKKKKIGERCRVCIDSEGWDEYTSEEQADWVKWEAEKAAAKAKDVATTSSKARPLSPLVGPRNANSAPALLVRMTKAQPPTPRSLSPIVGPRKAQPPTPRVEAKLEPTTPACPPVAHAVIVLAVQAPMVTWPKTMATKPAATVNRGPDSVRPPRMTAELTAKAKAEPPFPTAPRTQAAANAKVTEQCQCGGDGPLFAAERFRRDGAGVVKGSARRSAWVALSATVGRRGWLAAGVTKLSWRSTVRRRCKQKTNQSINQSIEQTTISTNKQRSHQAIPPTKQAVTDEVPTDLETAYDNTVRASSRSIASVSGILGAAEEQGQGQ